MAMTASVKGSPIKVVAMANTVESRIAWRNAASLREKSPAPTERAMTAASPVGTRLATA